MNSSFKEFSKFTEEVLTPFNDIFQKAFTVFSTSNVDIDVYDNGTSIQMIVEIPGFENKDIKISLEGKRLTITGNRELDNNPPKQHPAGKTILKEIKQRTFARTFDIGMEADESSIHALVKNGLLTLNIIRNTKTNNKAFNISVQ